MGTRLLKLQVQMLNDGTVHFDKALIRNVSKFFGLVIIDWIVAIATPGSNKHQKYTDRIAETTVVQVSQASPLPPPPS